MRTHYENPSILRAFEMFEKLSVEEQTRIREEMEEKALKNEVSMLAAARREGEKAGIRHTAFNMLTEGMDVKLISRITGLNENEIRQLQENSGAAMRA